MTLIVMIIEGQFLLPMRRVLGVINVEDNSRRRLGVAGNTVVHERLREPGEVRAGHTVLKPREGRGTREVLRGLSG